MRRATRDHAENAALSSWTLQATLDEFLRCRDANDAIGDLSEGLEARRQDLLCPDPSRRYPRSEEDRRELRSGAVVIRDFKAKVCADVCAASDAVQAFRSDMTGVQLLMFIDKIHLKCSTGSVMRRQCQMCSTAFFEAKEERCQG